MKNKLLVALVGFLLAMPVAVATAKDNPKMKPFIMASNAAGEMAGTVEQVTGKLAAAGFEIAGTYSPYPAATIVVVTNEGLRQAAAQSDFGGYAAGQRVAITDVGGEIQVAFTNPRYMASAYRMKSDLGAVADALSTALGNQGEFGPDTGMTDKELRGYHYMFGMEYFDEPSVLAKYDTQAAAIAAVEAGLAEGRSGITKVYRIDMPGKEEAVFGIAMDGSRGEGTMQDDAYIMSQIDFKPLRSSAHLPYEMLVSGGKVYALYARFRIAINFSDLSMMGSNSFMSIMECPTTIERALTRAAGGKVKKPST